MIGKHSPRLATRGHVGTCQTRTSGEGDNVDGKNPAPVDMADIPLLTGFHTCQVVQDFFHQQQETCKHFLSACVQLLCDQWIWLHQNLQALNDIKWYQQL